MSRVYGTIARTDGAWEINTEPQVHMLLKRMFASVAKTAHGSIWLSDTPQNCRDIVWFLARYPMIVDQQDDLYARALAYEKHLDLIDHVLSAKYVAPTVELAEPARDYQLLAAALAHETGELLLADQMGLGKTVSAIAFTVKPGTLPALVVTKTDLPEQWASFYARFAPNLRTHIITKAPMGTKRYRRGGKTIIGPVEPQDLNAIIQRGDPVPDVVIVNYHRLWQWVEILEKTIKSVVYDEAQELRTGNSLWYQGAQRLAKTTSYRLGLSGTPVYNYGGEMFSVLDVITPGKLGTEEEFRLAWCTTNDAGKVVIKEPDAFGAFLREQGLMLRRTTKDVGRELPKRIPVPLPVTADAAAIDSMKSDAVQLARTILQGNRKDAFIAGGELDYKMRMATGIAKAPAVCELVRMLVEGGENVVLFGWHKAFYAIVEERLADLKPVFRTGEETARQKRYSYEQFISGESKVLVISLRSGAGVDGLQHHCHTEVIGEFDWSPGVIDQCIMRLERDGQQHPVKVFYPYVDDGSDPVMMDTLNIKRNQAEPIIDPGRAASSPFVSSEAHMRKMAEDIIARYGKAKDIERPIEDAVA